jgi:hypothetical protein
MMSFTAFAAYVGLLTGIFTLWDRLAKGRPIAFLFFKDGEAKLIISNPGNYSVFILSAKTIPDVFFLNRDPNIRALIEDQLSGISYWPIEPKGTAEFLIVDRYRGGKRLSLDEQRVRFSVNWRRGSTTWLWQFPLYVRIDTSTINKMARKGVLRP